MNERYEVVGEPRSQASRAHAMAKMVKRPIAQAQLDASRKGGKKTFRKKSGERRSFAQSICGHVSGGNSNQIADQHCNFELGFTVYAARRVDRVTLIHDNAG
jgi:hypothetical protein